MPHPPRPADLAIDDLSPAVLQLLDADMCAALDFLVDHAAEVPGGQEIADCLTPSRRCRPVPAIADLRAG